jgi:hypothetical protein
METEESAHAHAAADELPIQPAGRHGSSERTVGEGGHESGRDLVVRS